MGEDKEWRASLDSQNKGKNEKYDMDYPSFINKLRTYTLIEPRWSYHGGRPSVNVCAFMCECVEDAFWVFRALALIGFLGLAPAEDVTDILEAGDDIWGVNNNIKPKKGVWKSNWTIGKLGYVIREPKSQEVHIFIY